jgi:hypothetical protein
MSLRGGYATPATAITTTTETLAQNIPAYPVSFPPNASGFVVVRGTLIVSTGAGTTQLVVKLRVGQSNTSTALVGTAAPVDSGASGSFAAPFVLIDSNGQVNLTGSGYSITVVQTSATGNGTVTAVNYEVDLITNS